MLAMQTMSTITQNDPVVLLQADVKESVRRHLRVEAAKSGKTMGDVLTDLLRTHGGYEPPQEPARGDNSKLASVGGRQVSGPSSKGK